MRLEDRTYIFLIAFTTARVKGDDAAGPVKAIVEYRRTAVRSMEKGGVSVQPSRHGHTRRGEPERYRIA